PSRRSARLRRLHAHDRRDDRRRRLAPRHPRAARRRPPRRPVRRRRRIPADGAAHARARRLLRCAVSRALLTRPPRRSSPARAPVLESHATLRYEGPVPLVAPSILSADFARLGDEVAAVTVAGADWIHVDVMDGHFVPPITIGPLVVRGIRSATRLPLDVHLMIESPERQLEEFVAAGATGVTVHVDACRDVPAALARIREGGAHPGLALNPPTPLERVRPFTSLIALLLVMDVTPRWGWRPFAE